MLQLPFFPKDFVFGFFTSKALTKAIDKISDDLWNKAVDEIEQTIKPTPIECELKLRYWTLIESSIQGRKKFTIGALYKGVCSYTYLYAHFLNSPERVAWMLKPYSRFIDLLGLAQLKTVERLVDISHLEIRGDDGKIIYANANLVIKMVPVLFALYDKNNS